MGQQGVPASPVGKKESDRKTKEIVIFNEYKFLKHQHVFCSEDPSNLKECLKEPLRRLEEKNKKLLKEKNRILEGKALVIQQENILKDMQIKLNHLQEQLKHPELMGCQERGKFCNCTRCPAQKLAMKQTQKSSYLKNFCFCLGNSVRIFVRYFLYCGCLYLTLLLLYKHLLDPTQTYQLDTPDSICPPSWTH